MQLSKFEFDGRFHFFKNKELSKKRRFPLKPDDVIVMSSYVHEWKGKPRSIVWYQCLMQQIIKNKLKLHTMIVRQYSHLKWYRLQTWYVSYRNIISLLIYPKIRWKLHVSTIFSEKPFLAYSLSVYARFGYLPVFLGMLTLSHYTL